MAYYGLRWRFIFNTVIHKQRQSIKGRNTYNFLLLSVQFFEYGVAAFKIVISQNDNQDFSKYLTCKAVIKDINLFDDFCPLWKECDITMT